MWGGVVLTLGVESTRETPSPPVGVGLHIFVGGLWALLSPAIHLPSDPSTTHRQVPQYSALTLTAAVEGGEGEAGAVSVAFCIGGYTSPNTSPRRARRLRRPNSPIVRNL